MSKPKLSTQEKLDIAINGLAKVAVRVTTKQEDFDPGRSAIRIANETLEQIGFRIVDAKAGEDAKDE